MKHGQGLGGENTHLLPALYILLALLDLQLLHRKKVYSMGVDIHFMTFIHAMDELTLQILDLRSVPSWHVA